MTSFSPLWWILLSSVLSVLSILALICPARRFDLVDHPAGRKKHAASTPLVGGIAIFLSLVLTHWLAGSLPGQSRTLMLALIVTVAIGAADDAHEIGHRSKFFAQLIAALLIASGTEVEVMHLGDLFGLGDLVLGKWSHLFSVIAIIGLMNAVNMIDGVDGLAGTQVLIPLLVFLAVAQAAENSNVATELSILLGAVLGFLMFNLRIPGRKRAMVFMGDTGSLLLGLLLAWYSIKLAGMTTSPLRPIAAVWIIAVPLLDMGAVMFLRMLHRKSPFHADRQHLHYLLCDAGLSESQAVWTLAAVSVTFSLLAMTAEAHGVPEAIMFCAFVALLLARL
ncbi:MAG: undecaprenyl/decaprenyl-phosphate alpha-N-acetylglucosaminyl 1-phosphate transferase [Dechloromonas sp.]|nr:MAG: undecaprenyl/decaprenyl-phosphate alpha-N-acetylglucosaminyl 1-phosphate transferase [Dechloromonas sp.]